MASASQSVQAITREKPKDKEPWDLVIVGYGCTGLAAAMYAGRLELKTLLVGENPGGVITWTDLVENYPGFIRLTGQELIDKLKAHADEYKVPMEYDKIESIQKNPDGTFQLHGQATNYVAKSVLVATGAKVRKLEVPGLQAFENRGIQYCALCDGALFKGKEMAVVGGSDSAVKEALVLSRYAKKVYLIYRGKELRAEPPNLDRLKQLPNIEILFNTNITEFRGTKFLEKIVLDKPFNGKKELGISAVFVAIGHEPNSGLVGPLGVKLNPKGEIVIDREAKTNVLGIFAAGDVVDTPFKQAIVGIGEAVSAVFSAFNYVSSKKK